MYITHIYTVKGDIAKVEVKHLNVRYARTRVSYLSEKDSLKYHRHTATIPWVWTTIDCDMNITDSQARYLEREYRLLIREKGEVVDKRIQQ